MIPIGPIFQSMRPRQWTKNAFVFAPLIFGQKLSDFQTLLSSIGAFLAFCLAAGAVYLFNDIRDVESDRLHPAKKQRPIAAGDLGVGTARGAGILFAAAALLLGGTIHIKIAGVLLLYLFLNFIYTVILKHEVILDVLLVAVGYLFRIVAGGLAVGVEISGYLWLCTLLLAILLALGKRRHELVVLEDAANHRQILDEYSPELLESMMSVMTASILVCYALYTQEAVGGEKNLKWTIPFVIYGIFRYLYLIHKKDMGGDPAEILFDDWRMTLNVILWALVAVFFVYFAG